MDIPLVDCAGVAQVSSVANCAASLSQEIVPGQPHVEALV